MTEYIKNMRKYIGHERLLIVGAGVIIHQNSMLLLQKRKDSGCWAIHGGALELGETTEEAAKRELLEETGLIANALEFIGVFSGPELFHTYPNGDMVAIVSIIYLCEDFSGKMLASTDETTDLQWFKLDDIPEDISPPDIPMIKQAVELLKKRYI